MEDNLDLYEYSRLMSQVRLTRWQELPKFPIYCDQLLQIVKDELSFMKLDNDNLITKSMVNNYVKWGMIPKPVKKKYERLHTVQMIVITILKQILPISEIKNGIQLQSSLYGSEGAYDAFCEALEDAMKRVFMPIVEKKEVYETEKVHIEYDRLAISSITTALANRMLTMKIIETKINANTPNKKGEAHE
ncbi:MAG: DUF1836 domain-containing protein [Sedimentibacter sp.]|uniref:DUF1836 domain-containing protein n=1 Tax=Sedimentibacter sp. TaxID=1960295 RepID=UPI0031585227